VTFPTTQQRSWFIAACTIHRWLVDPCGVWTSLVQCGWSIKHAGGRKASYWSAIRRRDSYPNCKHRAVWKRCNSLGHFFLWGANVLTLDSNEHYFRSRNLTLPQDPHSLRGSTRVLWTVSAARYCQSSLSNFSFAAGQKIPCFYGTRRFVAVLTRRFIPIFTCCFCIILFKTLSVPRIFMKSRFQDNWLRLEPSGI
jgi:hypothetical protein